MYKEIQIQGDIHVKGRNGYFKLASVEVFGEEDAYTLCLNSARSWKNSPSSIRGTKAELTALLNTLQGGINNG